MRTLEKLWVCKKTGVFFVASFLARCSCDKKVSMSCVWIIVRTKKTCSLFKYVEGGSNNSGERLAFRDIATRRVGQRDRTRWFRCLASSFAGSCLANGQTGRRKSAHPNRLQQATGLQGSLEQHSFQFTQTDAESAKMHSA